MDLTLPRHPIAVVAARTGLSPDVLRIWERRYQVVQPARSADGQRLYSDEDVERLRLLRLATEAGRSIGQIVKHSRSQLAALVAEDALSRAPAPAPDGAEHQTVIEDALDCARALDAAGFDAQLRRAIAMFGVPSFVERVAAPLLHRVGDDWHRGLLTTAQEHLASSVLQEIVLRAMWQMAPREDAPTVVIATPAGEQHVIGAALAAALAAGDGWRVVYLGADLPAADIAWSAQSTNAQAIGLSIIYIDDRKRVLRELNDLRSRVPEDVAIVVGGAGAGAIRGELEKLGIEVKSTASLPRPR